jgi:hypothetical protein
MRLFGLSGTARVMIASVVVICAVLMAAGLIVINFIYEFEQSAPFMAGIAVGCAHSVIKIIAMEKSLERIADTDKEKAKGLGKLLYSARLLITIAALASAVIFKAIGMFGVAAGILTLSLAAYAANMIFIRQGKKNKN